jgi:hypothetical protein
MNAMLRPAISLFCVAVRGLPVVLYPFGHRRRPGGFPAAANGSLIVKERPSRSARR